jgi:hypothetical protein
MVQKSKVDWWIFLLGWATPLLPVVLGLYQWLAVNNPTEGRVLILAGVTTFALVWAFTTPMRYRIEDGDITIRFGLFRVRVMVEEVVEVTPSFSLWSSPA